MPTTPTFFKDSLPRSSLEYIQYEAPFRRITLTRGEYDYAITAKLQIKNGHLVFGTYNEKNIARIEVWDLRSGRLLSELATPGGKIDVIYEINDNVIVVGHNNGFLTFFDLSRSSRPVQLAQINLPNRERGECVCDFALFAPGVLGLVTYVNEGFGYRPSNQMRVVRYQPENIATSLTIEAAMRVIHYGGDGAKILALGPTKFMIPGFDEIYIYDIAASTADKCIDRIEYGSDKYPLYTLQLHDKRVALLTRGKDKRLELDIWDLREGIVKEHVKTIRLSMCVDGLGSFHTLFENSLGELLLFNSDNARILIINPNQAPGSELIRTIQTSIGYTLGALFLDDGRTLAHSTARGFECIEFPGKSSVFLSEHVDARDGCGQTRLMVAAIAGDYDKVKALLKKGANKALTNVRGGETALDLAILNHHDRIISLIQEFGTFSWRLVESGYKGIVDKELLCPISYDIMNDPITMVTGITYDRASLVTYFATNGNLATLLCPVSRQPIARDSLKYGTARIIRNSITAFIERIEAEAATAVVAIGEAAGSAAIPDASTLSLSC